MSKQTFEIFKAILDPAIDDYEDFIRGTHSSGKGTREERIKYVQDYADGAFDLSITEEEAAFISDKANQYLDDVEAGKTWQGDDYVYHEYTVKLEEFEC